MVESGESVQELLEKLPPLVSEATVTTPVGVVGLDAVSVTVAVQDVAWPMATAPGEQITPVVVESFWGTVGFVTTASA
jgi:hypothetical protein